MSPSSDAFGRFRYFEVNWPGATGDITAYKQTKLYRWFCDGLIPSKYHQVLDEAYGSIGGDQHITPFTRSQLKKARSENVDQYLQMKAFNNILSSERITIERAFGMYVRKWGILWRPLEYSVKDNVLILKTCAKLHNLSINHWMSTGKIRLRLWGNNGIQNMYLYIHINYI